MASGDTLLVFTPPGAEFPASNFALVSTRNNHPILRFPDGTATVAYFTGVLPQHYDGGGVTVYVHWACSNTSGNIGWLIAFERIGDSQQDIDSDGFAADNVVTAVNVPGTSGNVDITSVAFTDGADMDSVAAGEGFRLRVTRNTGTDTSTGDAQLVAVEIRET